MTQYYTMPEVPALVGRTYNQVRWALLLRVVEPRIIGRTRLFTMKQVEQLKAHFAERAKTTEATQP
jgi:hypothetical protein